MAISFDLSFAPPYGVAERLSPQIERVVAPNPGPFTFRGTGVYIVGAGDAVAVIDPGPDMPEHLAALERALGARKVSHILITHSHRDHSPASRPLQALTGAPIYGFGKIPAPTASGEEGFDPDYMPDIAVTDGARLESIGFALDCVFTPGHASNHMCYALTEEKALFSGDHVMGWSTSVIAPPDGNMADYLASLEKLIARDDAILYPTHGAPIGAPGAYLRALLDHRRQREVQIAEVLREGSDTVEAIVARLYPGLAPALVPAAQATVLAHLEHMAAGGRA